MKHFYLILLGAFVLAGILPHDASAQVTTFQVAPDATSNTFSMVDSGSLIQVTVDADRCYCCQVKSTATADDPRFGTALTENPAQGSDLLGSFVEAGELSPALAQERSRLCFKSVASGNFTLDMLFGDGTAQADSVAVSCEETTLYGGFNTSVTDFNFLELTNTLANNDVTVTIDATDVVQGDEVFDDQTQTITANGRSDIDIHSVAGMGAFGPMTVCPLAPRGAVKATVSQYNIVTTEPLNFTPVAREDFTTR